MDAGAAPWSAPSMEVLGVILVIAAVIGVIYAASRHNTAARARRAKSLTDALAGDDPAVRVDPETGLATATVRGFTVRFRFTSRGSGSSSESWTEAEVDASHEPLILSMRLQTSLDGYFVRQGLAIDVQVGDPTFDAKYLVEGAPAAVVTRVLTPAVQRKLLLEEPNELETRPFGVLLARKGWRESPTDVRDFVDLAVSVAENIAPAILEARKAEAPPPTSAYRGSAVSPADQQKWEAAKQQVAEREGAEVAALKALRERREATRRTWAIVAVAIFLGIMGLTWALSLSR